MAEGLTHSPACRWCGKGPLKYIFPFKANVDGQAGGPKASFMMESCGRCGSFQVNPHPSFEAAKEFFRQRELYERPGIDPDGKMADPLARAEGRLSEYKIYAEAVMPLLPDYGTILDIGAGTGLMLSLFPDKYERVAVEPNPVAAQKAKERGLSVIERFVEEMDALPKPLALVIFNQSLDHFVRPDLVLGRHLNHLAPGGLVLISGLINPESLAAKATGPDFRLWHPFHQVYPPLEAVVSKLSCHGFKTLRTWRPYLNTPYGSIPGLAKSLFQLAKAFIFKGRPSSPSPPWPGNTISYLAAKELLFSPAKAREAPSDSFKLKQRNGGIPSPMSRE